MEQEDSYYLQDSRSLTGTNLMFWAKGGSYTSDIERAEVFTKEAAVAQNQSRSSDLPWPKSYIDARTRPVVDHQYLKDKPTTEGDAFYAQVRGRFDGNDITLLAKEGTKETTNLAHAKVFSREEVFMEWIGNSQLTVWPKHYIDGKQRRAVSSLNVNSKESLKGTGIVVKQYKQVSKDRYRCGRCQCFMTAENYYTQDCSRCGTDNRP